MNRQLRPLSRRQLLIGGASLASLAPRASNAIQFPEQQYPFNSTQTTDAEALASDEAYWRYVASFYDRTEGIINLEHGYWGKMAQPVEATYLAATRMVNQQNAYYARKGYPDDHRAATGLAATALAVAADELVLTRNASESFHSLIRQYRGLTATDAILWADIDYPGFKQGMAWLAKEHGCSAVQLALPAQADQATLLRHYLDAFAANPNLKLILLTHVSNQHGLRLPVREIAAAAKARGIDVICDCAQSWGLLNFTLPELGVDWAVFNLHKWIGAPVGVGALYMKRGSLAKVAPFPGEADPDNSRVYTRVHLATANFASFLAVPAALDFHQRVGPANKEARLRYLRNLWVSEAEQLPAIEMLGASEAETSTGMAAFRLRGQSQLEQLQALQARLENEFGIFTVVRKGLASGCCIRVTPQVFTSPDEITALLAALKKLA
ncbi:aminotransferase class V-fold PLP-dependent enzyme [Halioxenophilus sp. WMMB6]|uniref:aminotransferase class V-fold PLP-dependent enzyme n=1 Tax=Halioxenophilus sp. WMMB6 TaxID=3073815 RepID=UPI00295ED1B7|nr:aminotransferase class V-fold PLP-dependent enzyme [Halioxenophilus sp. WMMB6]